MIVILCVELIHLHVTILREYAVIGKYDCERTTNCAFYNVTINSLSKELLWPYRKDCRKYNRKFKLEFINCRMAGKMFSITGNPLVLIFCNKIFRNRSLFLWILMDFPIKFLHISEESIVFGFMTESIILKLFSMKFGTVSRAARGKIERIFKVASFCMSRIRIFDWF